jgi:hypothetical protein
VKESPLVVEFDHENRNPYFPPLLRSLRGRFDAQLAAKRDKDAGALLSEWPDGIPGQQITVDCETGEAALLEPLQDPRFAAIADRIKARGAKLFPPRETLPLDKATALHWIKQAVVDGQAKVIAGTLPEKIDGTPRLHFIVQPVESTEAKLASAIDGMAAAMREQTDAITKLLAALASKK